MGLDQGPVNLHVHATIRMKSPEDGLLFDERL